MNLQETQRQAEILERRFDLASSSKRMEMRPEVAKIIRRLRSRNYPIPRPLHRIEALLEAEAFDDMFDNMPV